MTHQEALSEWTACVSSNLPYLSAPQATVLAWWSFGIASTRSCGRLTVATFLALLRTQKVATIEQRLYEWCVEAPRKAGTQRQTLDVTTCFAPFLAWIVRVWHGKQIALALDATTLHDRFVVLTISVVYRGTGIPVAWTVLPAGQSRSWRREWLRMLRVLRPAIPPDWVVIVLADRGLYARWLFRRIVRLGWHPFLRINAGAKFRPAGQARWYWLRELVSPDGQPRQYAGTCFKHPDSRLPCTLLVWADDAHTDPWFILTDLAPGSADSAWYGLRAWCEQGFKCTKRGGWQWQMTRMTDPDRAARLWLALALAMFWMVAIGADLETGPPESCPDLPDLRPLLGGVRHGRMRHIRLVRLGWLWLLVQLIQQAPLPLPQQLVPEPWPITPFPHARDHPSAPMASDDRFPPQEVSR